MQKVTGILTKLRYRISLKKTIFLLQCQTPVSQPSDQSEANQADNTKTMINRHRPLHYDHICNPVKRQLKVKKTFLII